MKRIFWGAAFALWVMMVLIAYVYFGPPEHTEFLSGSKFFRERIAPVLDPLFLPEEDKGVLVARVTTARGSARYRPESSIVFRRIRNRQVVYNRSFVSTGERSNVELELFDGSKIMVGPDSILYLERPSDSVDQQTLVASIKVIRGKLSLSEKGSSQIILENRLGEKLVADGATEFSAQQRGEKLINEIKERVAKLRQIVFEREEQQRQLQLERQKRLALLSRLREKVPQRFQSSAPSGLFRQPASIPDRNHLTLALRKAKFGQLDEAMGHLASVITMEAYVSSSAFTTGMRFAIDGLIQLNLAEKKCQHVSELLGNVESAYPNDIDARLWLDEWRSEIRKRGCWE